MSNKKDAWIWYDVIVIAVYLKLLYSKTLHSPTFIFSYSPSPKPETFRLSDQKLIFAV